jgi:16S rRNA U516 pseudouridylate synthase RsuA-like enzyme
VKDKEWDILGSDELTEDSLAKKKHEKWINKLDVKFNKPVSTKPKKKVKKKKKKTVENPGADKKGELFKIYKYFENFLIYYSKDNEEEEEEEEEEGQTDIDPLTKEVIN